MRTKDRLMIGSLLAFGFLLAPIGGAAATTPPAAPASDSEHPRWQWPLDGERNVASPYRAPAHEYGAGHRGVDITASALTAVRAPADGVVAFRGVVVDRPMMSITHAGGYVSTFEPLVSTLSPGDLVSRGDIIGSVDMGGHSANGTLHVGVRLDGEYINPLLLFGDVPRAVLLPCCAPR